MMKIWQRYFLYEMIKTTLFFLVCFYGLYVLIDYASHTGSFHKNHVQFQWKEVASYYIYDFIKRIDFLLPLALLLGSIRTIISLNTNNELVALMSSGISLRTLMRPFILLGLLCTGLMYLNMEFVSPIALKKLKLIDDSRSSKKRDSQTSLAAQHILLEDKSTLIFQSYDSSQNRFFDVYWVRSIDDIYRIKFLFPNLDTPRGEFVDHLVRNSNGELAVLDSVEQMSLPDLRFNKKTLFETLTPAEELAVSELWKKLPEKQKATSEKQAQSIAAFYQKLLLPWFCLFAVIGPAPFCLYRTRNLPVFFIYALSIFGLLAFDVVIEAALILGKRQVMPPLLALGPPFAIIGGLLVWRYTRIK